MPAPKKRSSKSVKKPAPAKPAAKKAPAKPREPRVPVLKVAAAVNRDLKEIAKDDAELARGGLAATALALGREIDSKDTPASAKAACAARLRELLAELRREAAQARLERMRHQPQKTEAADPEPKDRVVDLRSRRHDRLAGRSGS